MYLDIFHKDNVPAFVELERLTLLLQENTVLFFRHQIVCLIAGEALKILDRFYEEGLTMNGQIVLCKGYNDKEEFL